jgi:son of sevenless
MLCLELMTGLPPYSNIPKDITVMFNITKGQLPSRPAHPATSHGLTDELWTLMTLCWDTNPQTRPSMSAIKKGVRELRWDLRSSPDACTDTLFRIPVIF